MNLDALTEHDIRAAARRVSEETSALTLLFDMAREGVQVVWVFDANVAHLFMDPYGHADFASPVHVASARRRDRQTTTEPAEAALATVLADFLFGERFSQNVPDSEQGSSVEQASGLRVILEPHATELHDAFLAIRRRTHQTAEKVTNALLGGPLQKKLQVELQSLIDSGDKNGGYVKRVQSLIRTHFNFLLPTSSLSQLRRARDLLKRRAFAYEADVSWLAEALSTEDALIRLDDLTQDWYGALLRASSPQRDSEKIGAEVNSSEQFRHARNDALALAKIQYLNELGAVAPVKKRFVLISAHGLLHRVAKEQARVHVPVMSPSVFLGSKHLFPISQQPTDDGISVETGQWVRLTHSLEMIHETGSRQRKAQQVPQPAGADADDLVDRFKSDWKSLLDFALPFLPASSTEAQALLISSELLQGASLKAFERSLYSALGDLLVLSSEISLRRGLPNQQLALGFVVPAARLAAFPQAERCMAAVSQPSSGGESIRLEVGEMMADLRREQEAAAGEDFFNYPMLLCLAVWFFSVGKIRPARTLAAHARAVVEVSSDKLPLVTGREAAFLESYFRRIDASDPLAHAKAVSALDFFDAAIVRERNFLESGSDASTPEEQNYRPEDELLIHEWRGRMARTGIYVAQITIELFRGPEQTNTLVAVSVRPYVRQLKENLSAIVRELESNEPRTMVDDHCAPGLIAVRNFAVADGLVTASTLLLFIAAGDPGRKRLSPYYALVDQLQSMADALPEPVQRQARRHLALLSLVWPSSGRPYTMLEDESESHASEQSAAVRMRRFLRWVAGNTSAGPGPELPS